VFEAEPEARGLMQRAPRARGASPFSRGNALHGVLQGAGLAALLLGGHAWLVASGVDAREARTVVFAALVVDVLLLTLANRAPAMPAAGCAARVVNPWVPRLAVAIALMLAGVVGLAPLRDLMGLDLPTAGSAAVGAALLVVAAAWLWGVRQVGRLR
jgi:Ca2+-transporting ATPase